MDEIQLEPECIQMKIGPRNNKTNEEIEKKDKDIELQAKSGKKKIIKSSKTIQNQENSAMEEEIDKVEIEKIKKKQKEAVKAKNEDE